MTNPPADYETPDDDQEQRGAGELLPEARALVHHRGYPRHSGPFAAARWGCVLWP